MHVETEAESADKSRSIRGFQKLEDARKGPPIPNFRLLASQTVRE